MSIRWPTTDDAQRASAGASVLSITKDDVFHILQNPRRRAVLRYLREEGADEFQVREVAETVAAWEHETTVDQLSSGERQRVYVSLYQSHLPKLDAHDIISYDQSRGLITPTPLLATLDPLLGDGVETADESLTVTAEPDESAPDEGGRAGLLTRFVGGHDQ